MSNNIEDKSNKYCTGCGACVATCPVNAISYKLNGEGFFQAFVDKDKCIKCGKCKKVCAKFSDKKEKGNKLKDGILYSARSRTKNIVKTCTSGGIAFEFAKYGIENGYQILGTIYDSQNNIAKAIIAQTKEEIELLKGSKYIQSNTQEALRELIKKCKEDPKAKFIVFGTPCQIFGISEMVKVNNIKNEIIKVDLFCHGVPSYFVWDKYLEEIAKRKKIQDISNVIFRSKHIEWHEFCMEIHHSKGAYYKVSEGCSFYKAFFDNVLLNKACFNCENRKNASMADIRLGDFWGKRYIDNKSGISAVLVFSEKGKKLLDKLQDKIEILEKVEIGECLKNQSIHDYQGFELREKAINMLNKEPLKKTIKQYRKYKSIKFKVKTTLKEATIILPYSIKRKLRKIMHMRRG